MTTALPERAPPVVHRRSMCLTVLRLCPSDLLDPVPVWETAVPAGEVGVALVDGTAPEWSGLERDARTAHGELLGAPVLTVAVVRGTGLSSAAVHVVEGCDVVLTAGDDTGLRRSAWDDRKDGVDTSLERILSLIGRVPQAALVSAQLLRARPTIATESFAYSMLLFGEPFRAWRDGTPRRPGGPEATSRVRIEIGPAASVIRLTRSRKHNAFDSRMREALCDALDALTTADGRPVVLLGDGRSFCSGGDLDEFGLAEDPVVAHNVRSSRSVARRLQRLSRRLVVGVHGHCIGAGIELASYARFVVAAAGTTFRLPEATLGLGLGAGGSAGIPQRIGRHRTLELLLRPDALGAEAALAWGLVDEIVDADALQPRCLELARELGRPV